MARRWSNQFRITFNGGPSTGTGGGSELLYRTPDSVFAVAVAPGTKFRAGAPRALFGGQFRQKNTTNWDATADGQRFVMVHPPPVPVDGPPLNVILNWFDQRRATRR